MSGDVGNQFFRRRAWPSLWRIALATLLWVGCNKGSERPAETAAAPSKTTPAAYLTRTLQAYAHTGRHREVSTLTLAYDVPQDALSQESTTQQRREDRTRFHLDYARPSRVRCAIERENNTLTLVSDGQHLWVSVDDPATDNLRQQVVQRVAPERLATSEFYAATELLDPVNPQQMLSLLLSLPVNLQLTPLGWLTGDTIVFRTLQDPSRVTELAPDTWRQSSCRRFQVATASGPFTYWVDPDREKVLRVDLPTGDLFAELTPDARPTNIQLTWDVESLDVAESSITSSDPFVFTPPAQSVRMQYFVLPPLTQVHPRLGQAIPAMTFERPDGTKESTESWAGRTAVLVWVDGQSASQRILPMIESIAPLYANRKPPVEFRAIHVNELSNAETNHTTLDAEPLPLLFDRTASGRDVLQVSAAPTLVILNSDQELSWFEVGANPQTDQLLLQVLEQLQSGHDLAKEVRTAAEVDRQRFEQQFALARRPDFADGFGSKTRPEPNKQLDGELVEASPFRHLLMTQAWQSNDAAEPGQVLAIPRRDGHDAHLVVLNEMREIVRLRLTGELMNRNALPIDESAYVTELRSAVDRRGTRWFAAFSPLGQFAYLFDEQGRLHAQYPPATQRHSGILDVQLDDLDADGTPEVYVGFADPQGCHRIDLQGNPMWTRHDFPSAVSLAAQRRATPRHLLVTGEQGTLLPIGAEGTTGSPISVGNRTIHQIFAAETSRERPTQMLGLCYTVEGRLIAVGLDAKLNERWSYGLPAGVYRKPLQIAQWVADGSNEAGYWILAGPDGSLHWIRDDGQQNDRCAFGAALFGFAAHPADTGVRLYVATTGRVMAYDVKQP